MNRHRIVQVPASSANLGPGYDVLAAALSLSLELEVQETGEFSVSSDVEVCRWTGPTCACARSSACTPPMAWRSRCARRSRCPVGWGPARRASWPAWPPQTTCSSSTRRSTTTRVSWRATPTTWPPRCTAGSWPADPAILCASSRPRAWRASWRCPPCRCPPRRPARRCRPRCPSTEASFNIAHATLLTLGLARSDFSLIGRGLDDRLHQPRRAALYPRSVELLHKAHELGALGATISGAGPAVLFWCQWQQTGDVLTALRAEAPDCDVRRVNFAPGGADVREL